jgi:nickel-dependent lactate racemase
MTTEINLPYGKGTITAHIPDAFRVEWIIPRKAPAASQPLRLVNQALDQPLGHTQISSFADARSAAIAINDKTRPVPNDILLPPLLDRLEHIGIPAENTRIIIATGTHLPMTVDSFNSILPKEIIQKYPVISHDCDANDLINLGTTSRGTKISVNRSFYDSELRIVVGNIEPHHFAGYSGGMKTASIGLTGRETINHNHSLLLDPASCIGEYDNNPLRQDIEEIGQQIGVHFALNAILTPEKEIVEILFGNPIDVIKAGISVANQIYQVQVDYKYDLVIAAASGYPKDINLYQSQKSLTNASRITKDGGYVILAAACPEGSGNKRYEEWMIGMTSCDQIFERFRKEGFQVGPHKAFQIARDASRVNILLVSEMPPELVSGLLLTPADSLEKAIINVTQKLSSDSKIAIMPWANITNPIIKT